MSHEGSFQAPKDVPFDTESACHRLGLAARLLQTLTAETIYSETGHRRTFIFAGDLPPSHYLPRISASYSSAAVWCVKSKLDYWEAQRLSPIELWEHIGRELDGFFPEDRNKAKWLTVISCTEYRPLIGTETIPLSHEEAILRTKGYCALGAGGLALLGSGTLYTWPEKIENLELCLTNTQKVDRRKFLDDSAYRFTYWANYTTALGTMLHELGHCFDLDHTPRGIMRRGGDDLNLVLAFPPPVSGSPLSLKSGTTNHRGLSIFRYKEVIFYENALADCQNVSVTRWGSSELIDNVGEAFWGTEVAQFLSVHRWFSESAISTCPCKTFFKE
nr:zinc metalloproteinase YIL108W [Hymenolepis microstoma]